METYNMIEYADLIASVADAALEKTVGNTRWTRAIARAWEYLDITSTVEFDRTTGDILVPSHDGRRLYRAGRTCECDAYRYGQPCWHRAAARLMLRAVQAAEAEAAANA